jgi:hypothetical protein
MPARALKEMHAASYNVARSRMPDGKATRDPR